MPLFVALLAAACALILALPPARRAEAPPALVTWLSKGAPAVAAHTAARFEPFLRRFEEGKLGRNLALSGLPYTVKQIVAAKLIGSVALALYCLLLFLATDSVLFGLLFVATPVLGWLLPDVFISARAESVRAAVLREQPSFLFTVAIMAEAGMNLQPALAAYCEQSGGALAGYLRVALQTAIGKPLSTVLTQLADVLEVQEFTFLVGHMVQAMERGAEGLAQSLRQQAAETWDKRRRQAQTLGHQASVKMFFPLFFLVLPAAVLVAVAPGVYLFFREFRF